MECDLKAKYLSAINGRFKSSSSNGKGTSATRSARRRTRYTHGPYTPKRVEARTARLRS